MKRFLFKSGKNSKYKIEFIVEAQDENEACRIIVDSYQCVNNNDIKGLLYEALKKRKDYAIKKYLSDVDQSYELYPSNTEPLVLNFTKIADYERIINGSTFEEIIDSFKEEKENLYNYQNVIEHHIDYDR